MKRFNLLALPLILISFFSCKKILGVPDCELPIDIRYNSSIGVIFKDKGTNRYLYADFNPLYNKDSIQISSTQNDPLILIKGLVNDTTTNESFWGINFGNIYDYRTDSSSFITQVCKNFIVRYSYNKTDTIRVCFKSKFIKCGSTFETISVYHANKLITTQTNTSAVNITIFKN